MFAIQYAFQFLKKNSKVKVLIFFSWVVSFVVSRFEIIMDPCESLWDPCGSLWVVLGFSNYEEFHCHNRGMAH